MSDSKPSVKQKGPQSSRPLMKDYDISANQGRVAIMRYDLVSHSRGLRRTFRIRRRVGNSVIEDTHADYAVHKRAA